MAKTLFKDANEVRPWHASVPPFPTVWMPRTKSAPSGTTVQSGQGQSLAADDGALQLLNGPDGLLAAARMEAEQIVQQAREEAARVQEEASSAGYAAGRADALAEDAALRQRLRELLSTMGSAYQSFCLDQTPALAALATEAAGRLMQEQLTLEPQRVLVIVQQAVEQASASRDLRLHLHPDDLESIRGFLDTPDAAVPVDLQIIADPSVERGGCWLETGHGEVDATVSGRLSRLAHSLDEVG